MLFDMLSFAPKGNIGGIEIAATLEEVFIDTLQATEHPVELGASITDHSFMRPREVVIRCGWSNATDWLAFAATGFSGELSSADYASSVYSRLLALQESREPFDVMTSKRIYPNMLISSLQVTTDATTSAVLMVQATCREILIARTKATKLPAKEAQANPASTAETEDAGVKMCRPANPGSGGAVAPEDM